MKTVISYADHFKLAPGMMALDKTLDAENCPVSYRKYFAAEWLAERTWADERISFAQNFLFSNNIDIKAICSTWYNNVYGHAVYEPPASRFVGMATPVPIIITWNSSDLEATLPDITLIQYEIEDHLSKVLHSNSAALQGIKNLQLMPMAKWIWLAMSDFDISVTSFELSRPAYHLSLWHSLQALEKLLKTALFSLRETECSVRKYGHNIAELVAALNNYGVTFSKRGNQIVEEIPMLVGGPSVRYLDDSFLSSERISLSNKAIKAHHLLLEFLALEGMRIASIIKTNPLNSIAKSAPPPADQELRAKVHLEHKKMCGHPTYSQPTHALPLRKNITHPVKT